MSSYKSAVIENFFLQSWNSSTQQLNQSIVTLQDVSNGINTYNSTHRTNHSNRNPANFFKDFIRKSSSANRNWPPKLLSLGYTATQRTGQGQAFEFVRMNPGQQLPFPPILPATNLVTEAIQSLSLPTMSRAMGRREETWLMQVLVRLNVIETHLSRCSAHKLIHVDHLQMGIKQKRTEIDGLYLGLCSNGDEAIITVEAKGKKDDIIVEQIKSQVDAVSGMPQLSNKKMVIPMAVKVIGKSIVHVVEFDAAFIGNPLPINLNIVSEGKYELKPFVPGIT